MTLASTLRFLLSVLGESCFYANFADTVKAAVHDFAGITLMLHLHVDKIHGLALIVGDFRIQLIFLACDTLLQIGLHVVVMVDHLIEVDTSCGLRDIRIRSVC